LNYIKGRNFFSRKEGYVSVEAVIAMSFFFIVFFLTLGFFTYIQPHSSLQREVHTLATIAERQGGLTAQDIQDFKDRLQTYSFIQQSTNPIEVTAVTSPDNTDVSDVVPLGGDGTVGTPYVPRNSKQIINVTATIPANSTMLRPIAKFFGVTSLSDYYEISESVLSERY
jgi:Flp pilus assembly protein TadG